MILVSLLAATNLALAPPTDEPPALPPASPAVVRVLSGRMSLVQGETIRTRTKGSAPLRVEGGAYLECGPASEVEISWRGRCSLRIRGSAALEWEAAPGDPATPHLRVVRSTRLDVEVRRGGMELDLPHGWTMEVERAVLGLRELPDGTLEIRHHGGRSVRVRSRVPRPAEDWPRRIAGGERARLFPVPPPRPDEDEEGDEDATTDR